MNFGFAVDTKIRPWVTCLPRQLFAAEETHTRVRVHYAVSDTTPEHQNTKVLLPRLSSLSKGVYNPKAFIPHAASLHQASAHCAIFPTLGLRYGPDSYGRQQWGILHNGRKPDAATPRGG